MEFQKENLSREDRRILNIFSEINDALINLKEIVAIRGEKVSSLCWVPLIRNCEDQLSKLFMATYKAEVTFRNPELDINQTYILEL